MKKLSLLIAMILALALLAGCGGSDGGGKAVKVSTVDELLAAIAPGAVIELAAGTYDLSSAANFGQPSGSEYYEWTEVFDGFQLSLKNISGLTIRTASDDPKATVITVDPRYANVFGFYNCSDVSVSGFTAGHTVGSECAGGVLYYEDCRNVSAASCRLYGCGIYGIETMRTEALKAEKCEIYDCSYGGVYLYETNGVEFVDCDIHDVNGAVIYASQCSNMTWNGTPLESNAYGYIADGVPVPAAG